LVHQRVDRDRVHPGERLVEYEQVGPLTFGLPAAIRRAAIVWARL
jgi:hypothetical protein